MTQYALNEYEIFFIEVMRKFDFLRNVGYEVSDLWIGGRVPLIVFRNRSVKRTICIDVEESLRVTIERGRNRALGRHERSFAIENIYKMLGCPELDNYRGTIAEELETRAKFIKDYLMPVITGELWIDELVKQRQSKSGT